MSSWCRQWRAHIVRVVLTHIFGKVWTPNEYYLRFQNYCSSQSIDYFFESIQCICWMQLVAREHSFRSILNWFFLFFVVTLVIYKRRGITSTVWRLFGMSKQPVTASVRVRLWTTILSKTFEGFCHQWKPVWYICMVPPPIEVIRDGNHFCLIKEIGFWNDRKHSGRFRIHIKLRELCISNSRSELWNVIHNINNIIINNNSLTNGHLGFIWICPVWEMKEIISFRKDSVYLCANRNHQKTSAAFQWIESPLCLIWLRKMSGEKMEMIWPNGRQWWMKCVVCGLMKSRQAI